MSENIYKKARKLFGDHNQMQVAQEEICELLIEVSKYLRKDHAGYRRDKMLEEMADVIIVLEQMQFILEFSNKELIDMVSTKHKRFERKIREEEKKRLDILDPSRLEKRPGAVRIISSASLKDSFVHESLRTKEQYDAAVNEVFNNKDIQTMSAGDFVKDYTKDWKTHVKGDFEPLYIKSLSDVLKIFSEVEYLRGICSAVYIKLPDDIDLEVLANEIRYYRHEFIEHGRALSKDYDYEGFPNFIGNIRYKNGFPSIIAFYNSSVPPHEKGTHKACMLEITDLGGLLK